MTSKLENRISMYYKVVEFFSNHLTTLEVTAPALTATVGNFNTQMSELDALMITANENTSGYAIQKQNYRTDMQTKALSITSALNAYGLISKNAPLAARAYATKTSLNGKRDTDVLYFCERLKSMADTNAANLTDLGITAGKLTAYGTAVTTFKTAIQDPADKRSEGKAAYEVAEVKVDEIDETLKITDAIMLAVREEHELLYNQYRADRLIDDNASGISTPDVIEVIESGNVETLFEIPYLESRSFKLNNKGNEPLQWALSVDGTNPSGDWQSINANTSSTLQSRTLGPEGDLLIVSNPGDADATVELTLIE